MIRVRRSLLVGAALALCSPGLPVAQRAVDPADAARGADLAVADAAVAWRDRLLVRLGAGLRAARIDGRFAIVGTDDGVRRAALEERLAALGTAEALVSLPLATLDRWHAVAVAATPAGLEAPGHLGRWLRLTTADRAARDRAIEVVRGLAEVALAYAEPIPQVQSVAAAGGNDLPPRTPDFESLETWTGPAPVGVGLAAGRRFVGSRGRDLQVFHTESSWVIDHEDLPSLDANVYVGIPPPGTDPQTDHAMGALGLLVAARNGYGVNGAVDLARPRLCGWFANGSIGQSIVLCTAEANPGDVLLMLGGYDLFQIGPRDFVPAEFYQFDFDAIATAVAQGVVVITAATNGNNDLDDPRFARRFDRSIRDSGATMVGATDRETTQRASYSNFGSRIDVSGWGGDLPTLGFGLLFFPGSDPRQAYVDRYSGTSSAASLVAGVAASLVNIARRQLGRTLTSREVRTLLRDHGSPVDGSLGPRPDLARALTALGLPDGLDVAAEDVRIGTSLVVRLSGEPGETSLVCASTTVGDFDGGWNRRLHLGVEGLAILGAVPLATREGSLTLPIPMEPTLVDLQLVVQAFRLGSGAPRVTTSAAVRLR